MRRDPAAPAVPELLLDAPPALGLVLDAADDIPSPQLAAIATRALEAAAAAAVETLKAEAGTVRTGATYARAELRTDITHHRVCAGQSDSISRPHDHLRLHRTARTTEGRELPIRSEAVRAAAPLVQLAFDNAIERELRAASIPVVADPSASCGWTVATVADLAAGLERSE